MKRATHLSFRLLSRRSSRGTSGSLRTRSWAGVLSLWAAGVVSAAPILEFAALAPIVPPVVQEPRPPVRPPASSGLYFPAPRHQFGPVVGLRHLYHSFAFRNPGALPIAIEEVKITCSCTVAGIAIDGVAASLPAVVPPGASGLLRLRATTEGLEGPKPVAITVRTDRGEEHLVVVIEGLPELEIEPKTIEFGQVVLGGEARSTLRVRSRDGTPLTAVDWGRPRPAAPAPARREGQTLEDYEAELEQHDRREQLGLREKPSELSLTFRPAGLGALDIDFDYRPTGRCGPRDLLVRVLFDGERALRLTLSAQVEGQVYLAPGPSVFLGAFPVGVPQRWEFVIHDRDPERAVAIRGAALRGAQREHLAVEVRPLPPESGARRTAVVVSAAASLPLGNLEAVLVVETDHPRFPKLETQFSAIAHGEKRRG
jgi:hypothetical protein